MKEFAEMPAERATRFAIEQLAAKPQEYADMPVAPDEVAHSIAITLKRIADLFDGTTLGINVAETIFNPATVQNREVRNNY